jgi:hypothetical protein
MYVVLESRTGPDPKANLCRTGACHRYQHDAVAVRCDVLLKFSILIAGSKRSAVMARPPTTVMARPSTTPPARTTPAPAGASLSRAAHGLSPQACQSAQLLVTTLAPNAGRRLFPLLRDSLPARRQRRRVALSPGPLLNPGQTLENAGSIPAASTPHRRSPLRYAGSPLRFGEHQ